MSLWTITLIIGYVLVVTLNLAFVFSFQTIIDVLICLVLIMLPAVIFLFVGRILPKSWFSEKRKIFHIGKIKKKFCEIVNVKSWKDKIPVGGRVAGFRLNKLDNPKDPKYLDRYIYESCFADWLHSSLCVWSFVGMAIVGFINVNLILRMALPIAILFCYQNLTSATIQWYMRPRIAKLRDIELKKLEKNKEMKME